MITMQTTLKYLFVAIVACVLVGAPMLAFGQIVAFQDAGLSSTGGLAPTLDTPPLDLADDLWKNVTAGEIDWLVTVSLALLFLVTALRSAMKSDKTGKLGDWLEEKLYGSDVRGTASTLALSFVGALATAGASGEPMTWAAVKMAVVAGVGAAAGWSVIWKRLALPLVRKIPKVGDLFEAKAKA